MHLVIGPHHDAPDALSRQRHGEQDNPDRRHAPDWDPPDSNHWRSQASSSAAVTRHTAVAITMANACLIRTTGRQPNHRRQNSTLAPAATALTEMNSSQGKPMAASSAGSPRAGASTVPPETARP